MPRPRPPCYRVCTWDGSRWRPHVTRTRNPKRIITSLLARGLDRREVVVELRPGAKIPMPLPDHAPPVRMAGRCVGIAGGTR